MGWLLPLIVLAQPAAEVSRVQDHFQRVEAALRTGGQGLDRERALRRSEMIDALAHYSNGANFPTNTAFVQPTPHFIDDAGARCAMAYLLELTGEDDLMWRVATADPFVRIGDLAGDPELESWLDHHGLSLTDAALIQPAYRYHFTECVCGSRIRDNLAVYEAQIVAGQVQVLNLIAGRELYAPGEWVAHSSDVYGASSRPRQLTLLVYGDPAEPAFRNYWYSCSQVRYRGVDPDLDVLARALVAGSQDACRQVLIDDDPDWDNTYQSDGADGCQSVDGSPPGVLLLAWLGLRRRRPVKRSAHG